jgi:hypothetical protein
MFTGQTSRIPGVLRLDHVKLELNRN